MGPMSERKRTGQPRNSPVLNVGASTEGVADNHHVVAALVEGAPGAVGDWDLVKDMA